MRIQGRTGAVHRPRRPIIGSPDAQPAATPDTAVGDGTSFLRLPRHPRPLPVSGGRPAEPGRRRRRHDGLDRPCRSGAARHRGARGPGALAPPQRPFAVAAGRNRGVRGADRRQRDPELGRCGHRGREAVRLRRPRARRRRVRRHAPEVQPARRLPRRLLHRRGRLGRGRVRRQRRQAAGVVHGRARSGRALDDGARARAGVPLRPRPAGRPSIGLVGIGVGAVGIVLGASLASVLGLYLGAVAMVALALARRDLRRRAVIVTVADLRSRDSRDIRRCAAPISAFSNPGSGRRPRRRGSTPRAGANG